jgi:hypothetical protein
MLVGISPIQTHSGRNNGFLRVEDEYSYYKFRPDNLQRVELPQGVNRRTKGPLQLSIDKLYKTDRTNLKQAPEQLE